MEVKMDKIESRGLSILAMSLSSFYMHLASAMVNRYTKQYEDLLIAKTELEIAKRNVELSKAFNEVGKTKA